MLEEEELLKETLSVAMPDAEKEGATEFGGEEKEGATGFPGKEYQNDGKKMETMKWVTDIRQMEKCQQINNDEKMFF